MITNFKLFESNSSGRFLTGTAAEEWCREMGIENFTVNGDGTVDTNAEVRLNHKKIWQQLPVRFGRCRDSFDCSFNWLITLEGCPEVVDVAFYCHENPLKTLYGIPKYAYVYSFNSATSDITLDKYIDAVEQIPDDIRMSSFRDIVYAMAVKKDQSLESVLFPDGMSKMFGKDDTDNIGSISDYI